ncbi:MAG: response regulator [Chloroflexi bacterium]|nr:MAG: response regulator [Chloroflexota bacterium]
MFNVPRVLENWQVLVIDDEVDSIALMCTLLEMHGATVYTASNGEEGLRLIREHRSQLKFVITDLQMPKIDGWQLLREVMSDTSLSLYNIPIVALTAHAMVGDRERAVAAGFEYFLTKPIDALTFVSDLLRLFIDIMDVEPLIEALDSV